MRRFGGFEGKEVEKSEDRSGKGYRILVVEDDAVTSLFLHDMLRRLDHDVVALASTGGEAIRWAEAEQPDVILMDIWLAGPMSGIDRKSTRLNSSHSQISYAVFCLKKKKKTEREHMTA